MDSTNLVTSVNAIISPKKKQPVISFFWKSMADFHVYSFLFNHAPVEIL